MAYLESVASNTTGLVDIIQAFAVGRGWALEARKEISLNFGDGYPWDVAFLSPPAGGMCVGVASSLNPSYTTQLRLFVYSYYEDGPDDLNGFSTGPLDTYAGVNYLNVWPTTKVYQFGEGQYIHIVIETAPNLFHHCGMGVLDKCSSYVGGQYAYGHHAGTYKAFLLEYSATYRSDHGYGIVRADLEGISDSWRSNSSIRAANSRAYFQTQNSDLQYMVDQTPNVSNGESVLVPIPVLYETTGLITADGYGTDMRVCFKGGFMPDIRMLDLGSLNPGDEITLGMDIWKVFPYCQKNGSNAFFNSATRGVAFKKVL